MAKSPKAPAPTPKARVFIVDDHPVLVEALISLINGTPDLVACGSAPSAQQALLAIKTLKPDLVVVDLSLENSSGLDLVRDLSARHSLLPALMLSTHDETLYAERALQAGAKGYIMKRESSQTILDGIRRVLRGQLFFSQVRTT